MIEELVERLTLDPDAADDDGGGYADGSYQDGAGGAGGSGAARGPRRFMGFARRLTGGGAGQKRTSGTPSYPA